MSGSCAEVGGGYRVTSGVEVARRRTRWMRIVHDVAWVRVAVRLGLERGGEVGDDYTRLPLAVESNGEEERERGGRSGCKIT